MLSVVCQLNLAIIPIANIMSLPRHKNWPLMIMKHHPRLIIVQQSLVDLRIRIVVAESLDDRSWLHLDLPWTWVAVSAAVHDWG